MAKLRALLSLLTLLPYSLAGDCWKDTPCSGPSDTAFPGPWEKNIYAPASRTVHPEAILSDLRTNADVDPDSLTATLHGNGSKVVFDFGREVGGIVTLDYTSTGSGALGLAFTEGKDWIGEYSDSSDGAFDEGDGAIYANFTGAGDDSYVMPDKRLRGGFRYLTLFLITHDSSDVDIRDVSLDLDFQPTWANLRAYQGYFDSSDEMLNRIWYSGAYTLQTNAVPVDTGRQVPTLSYGWANNATMGPGDTIIVDGAKRDRAVWPGDMGIAVPSSFVSIGDLASVKNALQTMYNTQNKETGAFDESGPPLSQKNSDTYHMWSMIGTYNYMLFNNDTEFLTKNWDGYIAAMEYIHGKVTYPSGLLHVTGTRDWARYGQGHNNTEAQMILYHTLRTGFDLATWAGHDDLSDTYNQRAEKLQSAINKYCWDSFYGAFKDNATDTTLHPQDANSMALLFGVVDQHRASSISKQLTKNWTPIGAVAPELPDNISPFISSFEIQGHLATGHTARALELIRRSWGWYLTNPNGTQSTVIEGYLQDGTFGYRSSRGYSHDASYVSHAHGWSSGPTSALTNYIVGITFTEPLGRTWKIAPQFGDLRSAQAGFTTSLGKFRAEWVRWRDGYVLEFEVPEGTSGEVTLPSVKKSTRANVRIDGRHVARGVSHLRDSATVAVGGGYHKVEVR